MSEIPAGLDTGCYIYHIRGRRLLFSHWAHQGAHASHAIMAQPPLTSSSASPAVGNLPPHCHTTHSVPPLGIICIYSFLVHGREEGHFFYHNLWDPLGGGQANTRHGVPVPAPTLSHAHAPPLPRAAALTPPARCCLCPPPG